MPAKSTGTSAGTRQTDERGARAKAGEVCNTLRARSDGARVAQLWRCADVGAGRQECLPPAHIHITCGVRWGLLPRLPRHFQYTTGSPGANGMLPPAGERITAPGRRLLPAAAVLAWPRWGETRSPCSGSRRFSWPCAQKTTETRPPERPGRSQHRTAARGPATRKRHESLCSRANNQCCRQHDGGAVRAGAEQLKSPSSGLRVAQVRCPAAVASHSRQSPSPGARGPCCATATAPR